MTDDVVRSALPRYGRTPATLLHDPTTSDRAVRLYALLDDYAGSNGRAWPKRQTLAEKLGCSVDTVDRALAELVAGGWLVKQARYHEHGGQTTSLYLLTAGPPAPARTAVGEPVGDGPDGAAPVPRGGRTHAAGGSRTHAAQKQYQSEPDPHTVPHDEPLPNVGDLGHNGNMNTTQTRKRPEVTDDHPGFSAFWSLFPRKIGKGAARRAYAGALAKGVTDEQLGAAAKRVAGRVTDVRYCPHPATWLNQERWTDETPTETASRGRLTPDKMCPDHVGQWADNCGACRSERIAKE